MLPIPPPRFPTANQIRCGVHGRIKGCAGNFTDDCEAFKLQGELVNSLRKVDDDSMTINLKHLAYVVTAADLGSISRAGTVLEVSPPAISAAIKGFERRYGYRLFVRNPARGLALTSTGRSFVAQARRLLEAERGFDNRAQGIGQELVGELHVGCYFITAPFLLGQVVRRLASRHPKLKLTMHEGDLIEVIRSLKAGHVDIAVTYDIYLDGGVVFEPLFETSPHVIISERDPLADKPALSLHDLVDRPMVLLDLPATQDYFLNYFHAHGLVPDVQYRLKSFEMVRTLVGAGAGFSFGFLPLPLIHSYQGNPVLRRPIEEPVRGPKVCLALLKGALPTRSLQAFMATARAVLNAGLLERYERLTAR